MTDDGTKTLPLNDIHAAAGARFGAFAGWSMPITYPAGVMREHQHTRENTGLFDISHMKLIEISGPGAAAMIAKACPIDAEGLGQSRSKLTVLLDDNAGIRDDLIVTRLGPQRFMVVANAGNAAADTAHLQALAKDFDCAVNPLDRVLLAVQGPGAEAALAAVGVDGSALSFMQGIEPHPGWFLTRSGYTGEDGFEVALPLDAARDFANRLLAVDGVMWIGLAARDSLRLEAGLCLHGQDIDTSTTPVEAGLLWAIPKPLRETGNFIGADALRAAIARGAAEKRVGLLPEGRQPVRGGAQLFDESGNPAGKVTSGGFGPSAGHPVAMGYVPTALAQVGTLLFADIRGNRVPVVVHALPFVPQRYKKG